MSSSGMRRRGDPSTSSATDFYRRYTPKEEEANEEANVYAERKSIGASLVVRSVFMYINTFSLRQCQRVIRASQYFYYSVALQIPQHGDVDVLLECVDCGTPFGCLTWRRKCSNCSNIFCSKCLAMDHALFNGLDTRKKSREKVCSYCFFQLCSRHCMATCCASLKIKELRRFLSRKGISTRGAIEKSDLVEQVRQWAVDLARDEGFAPLHDDV